jgi:pre-mRNA-splicing factor CWC26
LLTGLIVLVYTEIAPKMNSYLSKYGAVSEKKDDTHSKSSLKIVDFDEDPPPILVNQTSSSSSSVTVRTRRYDSDDEAQISKNNVEDDADVPRRRPIVSASSSSSSSSFVAATRKTGEDSDGDVQVPRRQRVGGDIDANVPRKRPRLDSDDETGEATTSTPFVPAPTSSSTSNSSSLVSNNIKNAFASAGLDADAVATTTYRDKTGKKIDMVSEFLRQQETKEVEAKVEESKRYELNVGAAQKELARQSALEIARAAQAPFARTKDDAELDSRLRAVERDGDPMLTSRRRIEGGGGVAARQIVQDNPMQAVQKPIYSGPAPALNRFGIRPGFRWDGVDRSNGWEAKVFAAKNAARAKEERRRAFAQTDM